MSERQLYHFRYGDKVVAFDTGEEYCPISEGIWTVTKVTRVFDTCDCGLCHPLDGRHQQGCSSLLGERSASGHPQYILLRREDSSEDIQKEISGWWAKPAEGQEARLLTPLSKECAEIVNPLHIFEAWRKVFFRETLKRMKPGKTPQAFEIVSTRRVADTCACLADADGDEPHGPNCGTRMGMGLFGHPQYVTILMSNGKIKEFLGSLFVYADTPAPPAKKC